MLLVCEKLEITIILYILYISIILKGTEHVEVAKSIRTVVERIHKKQKKVGTKANFFDLKS